MLATKLQKEIQDSVMSSGEIKIDDTRKLYFAPYFIEIIEVLPDYNYATKLDISYAKPMISDIRRLIRQYEWSTGRSLEE